MTRASTYTQLPLDTFAKVLGINPVHFAGAAGNTIWPYVTNCDNIWPQYAWQAEDVISREELAVAVQTAERDISIALGWTPGPDWIEDDRVPFPRYHRRSEATGWPHADVRGFRSAVKASRGEIRYPGRRLVTTIEAGATVTYSDEDGDGWDETATITVTTAVTAPNEIRVYFDGQMGRKEWEIRPVTSITISGGTAVIVAPSWLFVNPALWEAYPSTTPFAHIDLSTTGNLVSLVDVGWEHVNPALPHAEIIWSGRSEDVSQPTTTQDALLTMRDSHLGLVAPFPAAYDSDAGTWAEVCFDDGRDPWELALWYYAGEVNPDFLTGISGEPVDMYMAETIAILALSRLTKQVCSCGTIQTRALEYQVNMSIVSRSEGRFTVSTPDVLNCPFGTKVGEIMAWNRLYRMGSDNVLGSSSL